jgi:hypothetical protein
MLDDSKKLDIPVGIKKTDITEVLYLKQQFTKEKKSRSGSKQINKKFNSWGRKRRAFIKKMRMNE